MSTGTGFRSLPCASSPSRCASSGIDPPPQNGSSTGGGLPSVERMISARAAPSTVSLVRVLPLHQLLDDPEQALPLRVLRLLGRELLGQLDGSSTSEAKSTARQAASGRRAHQRWSVLG